MGGLDRKIPFDELKDYMENVKLIVCYGQTKDVLEEFAKKNNIKNIKVDNLKEAIVKAYENSEEKDTILFSPACASWDQFDTFEQRGELFKKIVNELC